MTIVIGWFPFHPFVEKLAIQILAPPLHLVSSVLLNIAANN
jgi:hypothetical protein